MSNHDIKYLKSLQAVRERSQEVYELAQQGKLQHFAFDAAKLAGVADHVVGLVKRDYGSIDQVPMHGRWRSYQIQTPDGTRDLIAEHVAKWRAADVSQWECARRTIDLFMVSVLIDAGAGSQWHYVDVLGRFARTEGLGLAALRMFERGVFSSSPDNPFQVDAAALEQLADGALAEGFQVTADNPLLGCENRAELLRALGRAMQLAPKYFGQGDGQPARPGFLLDYLSCAEEPRAVAVDDIWEVIIDGLAPVWPARSATVLDGVPVLGDVWQCDTLGTGPRSLVPFHKLSQWLTWSLLEVITRLAGLTVTGTEQLTGLPEYRNGGLFVDLGVLTLNESDRRRGLQDAGGVPCFDAGDPVVVEWRAMTVALLDRVAELVRQKCACGNRVEMLLSRVLEAGTWKAGREVAARLRGPSKSPPIDIVSDGTLF
ncbi:hypothetical protein GGI25_002175 [Coemansia spiralis]|uniref:Uracil phosphoribosyltransferase n=2 Tax=Coemansia TaxID=4863 RepID=A0A9W8G9E3_9FUNG|nr:hypothetical protein BX070DRAFT_188864 [Coemansia spiralis]KAJ1996184.1 hypothetical protein EDC05_000074 [Coemansia umbellata]KAJ2626059.1 hypothetical protein GGI26_000143 [Coemansia sp. RSA 1358]KAJ2678587.1 hypothetical protein GGI25_002175 [Coemansia spiralis]